MPKLVFDIETSALPLELFDDVQQEDWFRDAGKLADELARKARQTEIQQQMGLWPLTARVVCIAMLNVDSSRGQVLFASDHFEPDGDEAGAVEFVPCVDEV